ncbi:MAG: hydroxylamine reductase, partial [Spirochaetota bacterium]|nr:hydroxylamine reductase [Spirochaetota bacterium]
MFCYQCQETAGNKGCTIKGVCGKNESTANLQDMLIYALKGLAIVHSAGSDAGKLGTEDLREAGRLTAEALFATITNANFDEDRIAAYIDHVLRLRDSQAEKAGLDASSPDTAGFHDAAVWTGSGKA